MLKVVIIDGNAISRGLLSTVLTSGGHEVVGDGNTSPASLIRLIQLKPQIVCIDIGEADATSLAMLDQLREALPKSLVFLVSGKMEPVIVQQAIARGVHGFIVKPFNAVTVLSTIRSAVLKLVRKQSANRQDTSGGASGEVTES